MADFGYDVSDYCGIDPLFGSLDDFDRLVTAAHAQGLKVIHGQAVDDGILVPEVFDHPPHIVVC
jgi:hypothetical protein